MELDCQNCGSRCRIEFDVDETTEEHPLFCPFCGESVDEQYTEEDEDGEEEESNYLSRIFDEGRPDEEDE